ncbi:MAG: CpaF family protein [Acidimicrobiia bacterium]|nr:CpaF family protein [Acidimicrobiia bacterium]
MKLNERLKKAEATQSRADDSRVLPGKDPLDSIRDRAQIALFAKVGSRLNDATISEEELAMFVSDELRKVLDDETAPLTMEERKMLAQQLRDDLLGYGPLQPLLDMPDLTEIMVNGMDPIYVERNGKIEETDIRFSSVTHLRRVIDRIVGRVGRRIDESSPMVDARLPDGSRVNAIIPPLAVDGAVLTIRLFAKDPFTMSDLVGIDTITESTADFLQSCIEGRLNVIVSGGTGTGKTTLLNALSSYIPEEQRIITIEDAVELQLQQKHTIRLEARPANVEGKGQISIRDLVRNSLRMRPDRIIVGESRSGEALDMLQAMNTGHEGSLSTVHANSPRDAIARLETMVLMAGVELPDKAVREQVASALHLIVHLTRMPDGSRRVTNITEVVGMEGPTVTLQDVYEFDYEANVLRPTGIRPQFTDKLEALGFTFAADLFGDPADRRRALMKARR